MFALARKSRKIHEKFTKIFKPRHTKTAASQFPGHQRSRGLGNRNLHFIQEIGGWKESKALTHETPTQHKGEQLPNRRKAVATSNATLLKKQAPSSSSLVDLAIERMVLLASLVCAALSQRGDQSTRVGWITVSSCRLGLTVGRRELPYGRRQPVNRDFLRNQE